MNTLDWTQDDVDKFAAFIKSKGGKVVGVSGLWNGGYEFSIQPPPNAPHNWSFNMMKEYIDKR